MVSESRPTTIQEALEQFLLQLRANGRSEHTVLQYQRHVLCLERWMAGSGEGTSLAALNSQVVARFMVSPAARNRPDGKAKKATAVNAIRSSIRCFCSYLHDAGLVRANPARLLRRAICSPWPSRALDDSEVQRLLAALAMGQKAADLRDRTLFSLMLASGIRITSALGLDAEDVDLDRRELLLRGAKGDRVERVFLPQTAVPGLAALVASGSGPVFRNGRGARLTPRHANRRLGMLFRRAGICRVQGTHCLRHTFGTAMYRRTGDVLLVQEALRHRSIASTVVYARASDDQLRRALSES